MRLIYTAAGPRREVHARSRGARDPSLFAQGGETFNVGIDTGTPVDDADYAVPFAFTGTIDKLTVKLRAQ